MLKAERQFYQQLLGTLDNYRKGILLSLFRGELPMMERPMVMEKKILEAERKPEFNPVQANLTTINNLSKESTPDMSRIKFIRATPSFVWKDLKVYGPYDAGESTEMFPEVADLLVRKGRAEKV